MRYFMPKKILYTFSIKINKALCKQELVYTVQFFYEVTTILMWKECYYYYYLVEKIYSFVPPLRFCHSKNVKISKHFFILISEKFYNLLSYYSFTLVATFSLRILSIKLCDYLSEKKKIWPCK